MRQIKDLMTKDVKCMDPKTSIREIANQMMEKDVGSIPICDGDRLSGMVTDRDIIVKAVAEGRDTNQVSASDVMTSPIIYCFEDQDSGEAARLMELKQIRRLVVLNRDKRLVGILSLGDLAVRESESLAGEVLEKVAESPDTMAA